MPRKLKLNEAGIRELLKSDKVRDMLIPRAERVLAAAEANAPVVTGTYKRSLHIEVAAHPTRVVVQVVADAPHAHLVEADHGVLSRARDAAR
jgi:Bacteriophage HK97-gp10, putative tail-component